MNAIKVLLKLMVRGTELAELTLIWGFGDSDLREIKVPIVMGPSKGLKAHKWQSFYLVQLLFCLQGLTTCHGDPERFPKAMVK